MPRLEAIGHDGSLPAGRSKWTSYHVPMVSGSIDCPCNRTSGGPRSHRPPRRTTLSLWPNHVVSVVEPQNDFCGHCGRDPGRKTVCSGGCGVLQISTSVIFRLFAVRLIIPRFRISKAASTAASSDISRNIDCPRSLSRNHVLDKGTEIVIGPQKSTSMSWRRLSTHSIRS
jgi:hypothetical protein